MGVIMKQLWISRECRKLVSHKLQRRLVVISVVLGVSIFLLFLGGLMWALIGANRDPSVNLSALKFVSYGFFGVGGLGLVAFCFMWLVFVRDAKFEIHQQELRHAPDLFRFPPPELDVEEPPPTPGFAAGPEESTQMTDLHGGSRPDLVVAVSIEADVPRERPGVVSSDGTRHPSESSWTTGGVYDPASPSGGFSSTSSERPLTAVLPSRYYRASRIHSDMPRPRAVSQSDSLNDAVAVGNIASSSLSPHAVILEPSTLYLSRPSSVTTSSSKEKFIV